MSERSATLDFEVLAAMERSATVAEIAPLYAKGMNPKTPFKNAAAINRAIGEKWGESGVIDIKEAALRIYLNQSYDSDDSSDYSSEYESSSYDSSEEREAYREIFPEDESE